MWQCYAHNQALLRQIPIFIILNMYPENFFLYCFFLYPFSISFFPVSDDELKIRIWYLISLQSCIAERFFFYCCCCCLRLEYHINRGNTMSGKHTENNEKLLTQTNKHSMRLIQRELWFRPLLLYIYPFSDQNGMISLVAYLFNAIHAK